MTPAETGPETSTGENVATVRRFYDEIVNKRNTDLVPALFSPTFVDHVPHPIPGQPEGGIRAVTYLVDMLRSAMPDLSVRVDDVIAAGDKVVTRVTWQGTQTGELLGAEATGKNVAFQGIDIVRLARGKIAEHWGQVDVLAAVAELGFMPV